MSDSNNLAELVRVKEEDAKVLGDFVVTGNSIGRSYWGDMVQVVKQSSHSNSVKDKSTIYAAKLIDLTKLSESERNHLSDRSFQILPYLVFNKPSGGGLLDIFGVFLLAEKRLIIIEELVNATLDMVVTKSGHFDESQTQRVFKGLSSGVLYLHDTGLAHQNISPHNVYRNPSNDLKLGSLEYCTIYWDSDRSMVRLHKLPSNHGSVKPGRYIAPEITDGLEYDPSKADIYSLGILLCFMVLGEYPYDSGRGPDESREKQWEKAGLKLNDLLSDSAKDLLIHCLLDDQTERFNIKEVTTHPWITDYPPGEQRGKKVGEENAVGHHQQEQSAE